MGALYGYSFTKAALAALQALSPNIRRRIVERVKALATNPHPPGSKKLIGVMDGDNFVYRLRQGAHRVLYAVRPGPQIVVLDIGHRKDVYRGLR